MKHALSLASLILAAILLVSPAVSQDKVRLFSIDETPSAVSDKSSIASVREAEISFAQSADLTSRATSLEITLFDGKSYTVTPRGVEKRSIDDYTWRGLIEQKGFRGDVILTFNKGFVAGLIYSPAGVFEIVPRGTRHILVEIDQSLFPECGGVLAAEAEEQKPNALFSEIDSGDRLDVLVVYTTATKNFLGGEAQAQTLAQQAIDSTNTTYLNSRVRQRLRLVHSQEYEFTETGNSSNDLSTLRSNATVQGWRNERSADLVAMIGEVSDVCGIAYLIGGATQGGSAYSITARSCAVGNLTFAHELGHNMGSAHNPENAGNAPAFPYSYGHWIDGQFRTVMSYTNPCISGCVRRPYWSSPAVFYTGIATGLEGTRDNVRSLNITGDNVANYRFSGSSIRLTNYRNPEMLPRGIRRSLTWTSSNVGGNVRIELSRDHGSTWETVVQSTPNDGSEPITIWGRATKNARLRIVSLESPAVSDSSLQNISLR
ncbi:zinc-dependent metalloprotease [soil metagenome]